MRLVKQVYTLTRSFPDDEKFGLTSQMRRSAISVPSNIAEGAARGTAKEFVRFLQVARASLMELDTQVWLAKDLEYLSDTSELRQQLVRILAMLNGLIRRKAAG